MPDTDSLADNILADDILSVKLQGVEEKPCESQANVYDF